MFKIPKIPALLAKALSAKQETEVLQWPEVTKEKPTFTQAELQQLQSILRNDLRWCNQVLPLLQSDARTYYETCDVEKKDQPYQAHQFWFLNRARDQIVTIKQERKKLENLQTKIKALLRK